MKVPVAVLASGEGTTTEAFIRACVSQNLSAKVTLVICNKDGAGIFERIAKLNQEFGLDIKTVFISSRTHPAANGETIIPGGQTKAEEAAIRDLFIENKIELVILLGYLRRVGPELVREFGWRSDYTSPYQARMLNTHAGLLPETAGLWGLHIQEHAIEKGLPFGGQTLHVVSADYDDGSILAEHKVAIEPDDTPESLFAKVQTVEKQYLPNDVESFIKGREQYILEH